MPNQHVITTTYKSEGGSVTVKAETIEGDLSINIEREIPAGTTDGEFIIAIPTTALIGFAMGCTKKTGQAPSLVFTGLTVKTNSTTVPGNTFVITSTNGASWSIGDLPSVVNPITTAVTKLYVTNTGTAAALLSVRALIDSTPVLAG